MVQDWHEGKKSSVAWEEEEEKTSMKEWLGFEGQHRENVTFVLEVTPGMDLKPMQEEETEPVLLLFILTTHPSLCKFI